MSLLATDYKILAKALASRLHKAISDLVSSDQVGYIKGRFIGENVRVIEDLLISSKTKNVPGLLVLIDFEKAFDTVEWDFLFKTLKVLNFGPSFISWIRSLYTNITSCTVNNGHLSRYFGLSRGIRQGCPISALLFVLVAEILSVNLRSNNKVKGISIGKYNYKICQLADDTTIFVKDIHSLKVSIDDFQKFEKVSGLKLNLDKTEIIPLGPNRVEDLSLPKDLCKLKINKNAFKTLGIWFSSNLEESIELNFEGRLKKIEAILSIWKQRSLSWLGRIMIIKTLLLSQITHLLSMIYTPKSILDKVDNLMFKFLWNDKPPRIKRNTIIARIKDGGLKMPDIYSFHEAQKIMWIKRLILNDKGKWQNLFFELTRFDKNLLDHKLPHTYLQKYQECKFHHQVLNAWYNIKSKPPNSIQDIENENVFLNKYITTNNSPIHPSMLGLEQDLMSLKLSNLLTNNGELSSAADLKLRPQWNIIF